MAENKPKQGNGSKQQSKPKANNVGAPKRDRAAEISGQGFNIIEPGGKPKYYSGV